MSKKFKKHLRKHKSALFNGAQIIVIIGILAGVLNNYLTLKEEQKQRKSDIQWVGDNLHTKTENTHANDVKIAEIQKVLASLENK